MTTQIKVSLLLTAGIALVGCDKSFEDYGDLEYVEDDSMQLADRDDDEDGEWLEASGVVAPETIDNHAPCGEQTLLTVHATSGATYVFCGLGDGMTGVLEELPADGRADSLIDLYATPTELLHAVTPEDEKVPSEIVTAVERGELDPGVAPAEVLEVGISQPPVPVATGYCSDVPGFNSKYGWLNSFLPFIEEFVADQSACENHIWYTTQSYPWGAHQRTASSYQVYAEYGSAPWSGACAAKEHVLSCDGVTLFEALKKEDSDSSWSTSLSYWVSEGSVATWKMYANSAKSCAGTADRDNMRFTGNSEPGAYHYYKTIFVKWMDGCQ
ncbi:hypothetical protein [Pseudenhygromyxa sp. WMMC2535]|uniref:hypothetical protein n=1 Tax=Pseudenhygromyxa sp. WMMC2535 TaxID=2712867 RepID=UPI001C3CE8DD|nr:hypothetical protein [Pseudenhygromyxa sp. WMMC2535]